MRTFGEAPPPPTFFDRLKSSLAKTGLGEILTKKKLDAETVAELEEALIRADMGTSQAAKLARRLPGTGTTPKYRGGSSRRCWPAKSRPCSRRFRNP